MRIRPFDAVLWDMDGTLADSEPLHDLTFKLALADLGIEPNCDLHPELLGHSERENYDWLCKTHGLAMEYGEWVESRYRHYLANIGQVSLSPEAARVWQCCTQLEIPQAIVSNSDRMLLDANLRVCGLARPGLTSVSRNDVRVGKPDPEPYLRAALLLNVDPKRCAVVEDSPTGLQAGRSAAMRTFFMPCLDSRMAGDSAPFAELERLLEVKVDKKTI